MFFKKTEHTYVANSRACFKEIFLSTRHAYFMTLVVNGIKSIEDTLFTFK